MKEEIGYTLEEAKVKLQELHATRQQAKNTLEQSSQAILRMEGYIACLVDKQKQEEENEDIPDEGTGS